MWYQNIWLKKTVVFLLAATIYVALIPAAVQSAIGFFAVGWVMVDVIDKLFN